MNIKTALQLSALCVGLGLASPASADGGDSSTMTEDENGYTVLFSGQRLVSDSGYYHLEMQGDGNLVEYADCGNFNVVWANNRSGFGGSDVFSPYVAFQQDGNFVEYPWFGNVIWASNPTFGGGGSLRLQDDGNIVIYPYSGGVAWATGTHGNFRGVHCGETASYTYIVPGFTASNPGLLGGGSIVFDECGNYCAQNSQCVGFTWRPAPPLDGACQLYNAASRPNWTVGGGDGSVAGIIVSGVAPSGN